MKRFGFTTDRTRCGGGFGRPDREACLCTFPCGRACWPGSASPSWPPKKNAIPPGCCQTCGFDLAGPPPTTPCPESGAPVDPQRECKALPPKQRPRLHISPPPLSVFLRVPFPRIFSTHSVYISTLNSNLPIVRPKNIVCLYPIPRYSVTCTLVPRLRLAGAGAKKGSVVRLTAQKACPAFSMSQSLFHRGRAAVTG